MRETDWEVTQDSINEQVARESYLQWLHDQEKRANQDSVRSKGSTIYSSPMLTSGSMCVEKRLFSVQSKSASATCSSAQMDQTTAATSAQRSPDVRPTRASPRHRCMTSSAQNSPTNASPKQQNSSRWQCGTPQANSADKNNAAVIAFLAGAPVSPPDVRGATAGAMASGGASSSFAETDSMSTSFDPALYGKATKPSKTFFAVQ